VPGETDNVQVRSVIGRLLEHSRVFYFKRGDEEELWLSSADWMNRNMLRRVELCWPVTDPALRARVMDECIHAYLGDTRDAWALQPKGLYERVAAPQGRQRAAQMVSAQNTLMGRYGTKG
jgi:polyphosphate kinase